MDYITNIDSNGLQHDPDEVLAHHTYVVENRRDMSCPLAPLTG